MYSKGAMNMKKKLVIFTMFCMMFITGCNQANNSADMSAYEGFTETNNQYVQISMQEAADNIKNKESGIFYFGYPTCPWCIEAVPVMNEIAKELHKTIYYVNTSEAKDSERDALKAAAPGLWQLGPDGKDHFYVPQTIVIVEGEIVSANMGTVVGHNAHERKMTSDEVAQLKEIYTNMFKKLN